MRKIEITVPQQHAAKVISYLQDECGVANNLAAIKGETSTLLTMFVPGAGDVSTLPQTTFSYQ